MSDIMKIKGKLLEDFGRVCRRFALPLVMTASPFVAAAQAPSQQDPAYLLYKKTLEREMATFKGSESERQAHEEAIRVAYVQALIKAKEQHKNGTQSQSVTPVEVDYDAVLREDSRKNFLQIFERSKNSYSHYLDSLNHETEIKVRKAQGADQRVYTIDPLAIDIGKSLRFSTEETVKMLLESQGMTYRQSEIDALVERLDMKADNAAGKRMSVPGAAQLSIENGLSSIIIPPSNFGTANSSRMGTVEYVTYVNLHESFHAIDTVYVPRYNDAKYAHGAEAVADLYALGEMVRQGYPLEVMSQRSAWAHENVSSDTTHSSMHSVNALQKMLENPSEMQKFKKMHPDAAIKLYYGIAHETGVVGGGYGSIKDYLNSFEDNFKAADHTAHDHDHGGTHDHEAHGHTSPSTFGQRLTLEQANKIYEEAYQWDAPTVLAERCFKDHGKMTLETRAQVYAEMHGEISTQLRKETTLEGVTLQMEKLRELRMAFINNGHLNFMAINENRGVDLSQTERCLKDAKAGEKYASAQSHTTGRTLDLTAHFTPPGR